LVAAPKRHVVRVADLNDEEASELGPLLKTASILTELTAPEQRYVCASSHGSDEATHLHWIIQSVGAEIVQRYGSQRSQALQAAMVVADEHPRRH
jgi:hypothetical protein